jgi:hypothetical protein
VLLRIDRYAGLRRCATRYAMGRDMHPDGGRVARVLRSLRPPPTRIFDATRSIGSGIHHLMRPSPKTRGTRDVGDQSAEEVTAAVEL